MKPFETVKLSASVQGIIDEISVKRGDTVHQGQTIAHLEYELEQSELELARIRASNMHPIESSAARVKFLEHKYKRIKTLNTNKVSTDAALEEVEADLKMAKQELLEAQLNLKIARMEADRAELLLAQRMIKSPVDGVVVERLMSPGEYRNEQSHILTVAQLDPLNVEVFVPLPLHGRIKIGDRALVRPEAPVGGVYPATVTVVDKVYDAASGTFGVRLELPNPDLRLPAGIRCKIDFDATIAEVVSERSEENASVAKSDARTSPEAQ